MFNDAGDFTLLSTDNSAIQFDYLFESIKVRACGFTEVTFNTPLNLNVWYFYSVTFIDNKATLNILRNG